MKAVILCGGRGSRMNPITENTPKALLRILNRPVIDSVIEKIVKSGITEIYLSLGYMANEIAEHCGKKDYGAEIIFCPENKPLGTAGGVKNCIENSDEDILVVNGESVFDIDLQGLFDLHYATDSDFTVCGIETEEPRNYTVISCDDDSSIKSFADNPTWEQTDGNLINTGIYVLKGDVLAKIPRNTEYDFSENLFPEIFSDNLRFMCYKAEGLCCSINDFAAYRKITEKILDSGCRNFGFEGTFYGKDTVLENDVILRAPCLVGKNTIIGESSVIGPFCVIGNNCKISENCVISGTIMGENCKTGSNAELTGCITDDCVAVDDNCLAEEGCVIGFNSRVGRFSRILSGNKIWPGRRVAPETVVSRDMHYENPERIEFDIFGLSGKANSQIGLDDIVLLGQAIASTPGIERIGVGSDESYLSENFRAVLISGMRASGAVCYDFGEMFRAQGYFYSAYCNLDFFVYVDSSGDIVSFSFFGKNGLPVNSKAAVTINNNCKFSAFSFSEPSEYKEVFNMKLFSVVYKSFFKKLCPLPLKKLRVTVETENSVISSLAGELFDKSEIVGSGKRSIQILINNTGGELFVVENGTVFSGERILSLLCELENADGNDVIVPEDAPSFVEENSEKYSGNVFRVYENSTENFNFSDRFVLKSVWTFDMFLMVAKLLNVLEEADISLSELFDSYRNFALKKTVMDIDCDSSGIKNLILSCGADRKTGEIYYIFDGKPGKVRLRQLGNSRKIRILAEARDMETAKELSVFVTKKIKDANIDKDMQK